MSRRRLIAGNWKMNGTLAETHLLLVAIGEGIASVPEDVDLLVLPPFTALVEAAARLLESGGRIALGAQDLHWEANGAYTGEISGPMLRELGCAYVLVGHSERRNIFGEGGEVLLKKLEAAHAHDLIPILCVGESLSQREAGETDAVLDRQMEETFHRLSPEAAGRTVLAYEPVWAIGTGRTATPDQAHEAHRHLRGAVESRFGSEIARAIRIIYGGSVQPANAAALLERPDLDGALVGGSSLRATEFLSIARAGGAA